MALVRAAEADPDCRMEFDHVDVETVVAALVKCRMVVLRGALPIAAIEKARSELSELLRDQLEGRRSVYGATSEGGRRYQNAIDDGRREMLLPLEFGERSLVLPLLSVLSHEDVLGPAAAVHSLGAVLSEPGAPTQGWHRDSEYLFGEDRDGAALYTEVSGQALPSFAVTVIAPLLNLTAEHGPTQFAIGSSHLFGVSMEKSKPVTHKIKIPTLKIGDVAIFDYGVLHRGGPNLSDDLRSLLYITYSRSWFKDKNFGGGGEQPPPSMARRGAEAVREWFGARQAADLKARDAPQKHEAALRRLWPDLHDDELKELAWIHRSTRFAIIPEISSSEDASSSSNIPLESLRLPFFLEEEGAASSTEQQINK